MEDLNNPDEETQRLLNELGDREQLEVRAKELGVEFRSNISDDTLRQRVADAVKDLTPDDSTDGESTDSDDESSDDSDPENDSTDDQPEEEDNPIVETEPEVEKISITNDGKNLRRIEGVELTPGASCTLTEDQMNNKSLMGKVNRMIELGIFVRS